MTKGEAAKLMAMLQAAWPRAAWPIETCQIYEANLLDLDADAALIAVNGIIRSSTFPPSLGEIFTAAKALTDEYAEALDRLSGEMCRGMGGWASDTDKQILARKRSRFEAAARKLGRSTDSSRERILGPGVSETPRLPGQEGAAKASEECTPPAPTDPTPLDGPGEAGEVGP